MNESLGFSHRNYDERINIDYVQYGGAALNVRQRWEVYKYAVDGEPNIHDRIVEDLVLRGDETIVDFGCADGSVLLKTRTDRGHKGRLIGIDIDETNFTASQNKINEMDLLPIDFCVADALEAGIQDESADVALALFVLYHLPPEEALDKFKRVLKPGGVFISATSGKANKARHREFEKQAARHLGVEPPVVFSETCNNVRLRALLPKYFENIREYSQNTYMRIPPEGVEDYLDSLQTMSYSCDPKVPGGDWRRALEQIVLPKISQEIEQNGYFVDVIDRYFYTATKPKE